LGPTPGSLLNSSIRRLTGIAVEGRVSGIVTSFFGWFAGNGRS
jgi:hypothetical protein